MSVNQRLYLGNIPYSATEAEILEFLGLSREREASVELVASRENPARKLGFGFVTVPLGKVESALERNGATLRERRIKVSLARENGPKRWEKAPSRGRSSAVMRAKPQRGIPKAALEKLERLRLSLEAKKSSGTSHDQPEGSPEQAEATPTAKPARPPLLVDVGANLTNFRFKDQVEAVLERSLAVGVHKLMVTGTSVEQSQVALLLAQSLPGVLYSTAGVHPHNAKNWDSSCTEILESLLSNPQVVAVGETGLDFNRMLSTRAQQTKAFAAHVELACKLRKPLFIHEREGHKMLVHVLLDAKSEQQDGLPPILIHCFTGTEDEARKYIQLGFYIGVTGFICKEDRGKEVREILSEGVVPLDRLILETDAPFMLPPLPARDYGGMDPRSRNNEPCTLPLVAATVAELYGVTVQEVADRTTANAMALFGL